MKINVEKLVPKEWIVEYRKGDRMKVYYLQKGRGSAPKPFTLPRSIEVDENFMEAVGMYMGDGKLSMDDVHLGYASIDCDVVKSVLDFFMQRFGIRLYDMTISLRFKIFKKESSRNWAMILNLPISKFRMQNTQRASKECCDVEITGKVFRIIFERILHKVKHGDYLHDKKLRRAFLRGIFAAEGSIGINNTENYIVCIQFCLGYHEHPLVTLVKQALQMEGITYHELRKESDHSWTIQVTSWKNYHKLWKIDLFRLNQRKELRFLTKLKITKFSCKITEKMKGRLFHQWHLSQRQLSMLIGAHPAFLCKVYTKQREFVDIEYLINLAKIASVPLGEVKKHIIEFRVNDVTPVADREFIDFIFDLKRFVT